MLIKSFMAGPWQTNCYVVAPSAGSECVIVDPGQNALAGIKDVVNENNLKPIAILVTHGHLDHMWSVFPVAKGYEIPALIHQSDRHLLSDPASGLSQQTRAMLPEIVGKDDLFLEPEEVIEVGEQTNLELAGMEFVVRHTPGHTQGSVIFISGLSTPTIFTGDTLFAGAIGRTDLPGSSPQLMDRSLQEVILNLPKDSNIYPGHGPSSRMDIELHSNPYLIRASQGLSAT